MTRFELQQKKDRLLNQLLEIDKQIERFETAFDIHDKEKPFYKYTIKELNDLFMISERAYNYAIENREENILDYNANVSKDLQILFAK